MRRAIAVVVLTGCTFAPNRALEGPAADAARSDAAEPDAAEPDATQPDAPPVALHLHIEADIDGRSDLILKGTTVTWMHHQFAAPGRQGFTDFPTKLDAALWLPTWPDVPDAENRDCECMSSTFAALPVGVPRAPATVTITPSQARGAPTAVQLPSASNDYTLIVELDDVGFGGSSNYVIEVDVVP
ncbi:MAG: exported protein of unknown function [Deltaproteobacteria bacterium]|nr:exported protein of unknown function [Deltaproteobacteria bacterium]